LETATIERPAASAVRKAPAARKGAQRTPDRRIARSRAALRQAIIDSMEECGFEAVTVNDLCARADVTRGTFYNHFKDKEGLLQSIEDEVMAGLSGFQERMSALSLGEVAACLMADKPLPFLVDLFDYLRSEGAFLHAVMGPGGDIRFAPRLRDSVCTCLVTSILHERYRTDPTPLYSIYRRHHADVRATIVEVMEEACREYGDKVMTIAITGSGGLLLAQWLGVEFVQEVIASRRRSRRSSRRPTWPSSWAARMRRSSTSTTASSSA
jgi:AcrR family transcriptional regulator